MAKVSGPLMSLTASGKMGKAIVFMTWRGIQDVRKWLIPANPKTVAQQAVRDNFTSSVEKYHELEGEDMEALRQVVKGKPLTGFNQWVKWVRDCHEAAKTWVRIKKVSATTITGTGATIKATPDAAGKLKVSLGTKPGTWLKTFDEADPGGGADEEHSVVITGLTAATVYWYTVDYPEVTAKYGHTGWYTFTTTA